MVLKDLPAQFQSFTFSSSASQQEDMIPCPDVKRTVMIRPAFDSVQIPVSADSGYAPLPTCLFEFKRSAGHYCCTRSFSAPHASDRSTMAIFTASSGPCTAGPQLLLLGVVASCLQTHDRHLRHPIWCDLKHARSCSYRLT